MPFEKGNKLGNRFKPGHDPNRNAGGRPKLLVGGVQRGGRQGLCKVIDNALAEAINDGTVKEYVHEAIHSDAASFWAFFKSVVLPIMPREKSLEITQSVDGAISQISTRELKQIAAETLQTIDIEPENDPETEQNCSKQVAKTQNTKEKANE